MKKSNDVDVQFIREACKKPICECFDKELLERLVCKYPVLDVIEYDCELSLEFIRELQNDCREFYSNKYDSILDFTGNVKALKKIGSKSLEMINMDCKNGELDFALMEDVNGKIYYFPVEVSNQFRPKGYRALPTSEKCLFRIDGDGVYWWNEPAWISNTTKRIRIDGFKNNFVIVNGKAVNRAIWIGNDLDHLNNLGYSVKYYAQMLNNVVIDIDTVYE